MTINSTRYIDDTVPAWHRWVWLLLFFGYGAGALAQQLPWLAGIIGLIWFIRAPSQSLANPSWRLYLAMLALILVPAAISLPDSHAPLRSSISTMLRLVFYGFGGLFLLQVTLFDRDWRKLQWIVFGFIMFFAADGVLQFFTGTNVAGEPLYEDPLYGPRVTGWLWVDYGHAMAILTPFVLEMLFQYGRRQPWLWLGLVLFVTAIFLSGSRASVALFGVAVLLHALYSKRYLGWRTLLWLGGFLACLVATTFLLLMLFSNLDERWFDGLGVFSQDSAEREAATSYRTVIWAEAWKQFQENLFNGVGLRGFRVSSMETLAMAEGLPEKPAGWHAHLIILEMAVNLGTVGLLGYLVLYGWWCRWLWRASRVAMAPGLAVLIAWFPLTSYLAAFSMRISAMLWPMLALAIMLDKWARPKPSQDQQQSSSALDTQDGVAIESQLLGSDSIGANPRRILIVRLSAIGDVVFSSPLIMALKKRYPQAEISWLVEPPAAPLIQANPNLTEVIVWPKGEWQLLWRNRQYVDLARAVLTFRRQLRARRFDLVLDVQGLMKSAVLARLTGAPQRIGFVAKEKTGWLLTRRLTKRADNTQISSEYRGFAEDIGLDTDSFDLSVALTEEDCERAREGLEQGPYAVIAPFTTRPQKHWFDSYWFELAELIDRQFGLRVVMLGGPADMDHAATLADGSVIQSRVGQLSLRGSAGVISQASLLVGVDTGLTHMGIAFNVPTVAIFGSTCPYRDTGRDNARVIYHHLPCSPCRRNPTCDGRFDCLREISPQEVMNHCRELLAAGAPT